MSILDMSILDKARKLESRIAHALSQAAEDAVGPSAREPLEIALAIVDAVENHVQSGSRGTRLFPFNHIAVTVVAPTRDARVHFDALFQSTPSLRARIVERLRSAGCDVADLRVDIDYVESAAADWTQPQFHVAFDRVAVPTPEPPPIDPAPARVEVTVVRGAAERRTYSLALPRIDLGRGVEVRDQRHRLLRSNNVVFVDGPDTVNQTVSRRHAHISLDASSGEHRLHDDRSVHGTEIVRGGRTIPVPPGSRGVRLRSGDEIVLGDARVRIKIDAAPAKNS